MLFTPCESPLGLCFQQLFQPSLTLLLCDILSSMHLIPQKQCKTHLSINQSMSRLMRTAVAEVFCCSPHQILLFYNTFANAPFQRTWVYVVFVTAMGYINSAANPVLYSIFSQNFRKKFSKIFMSKCQEEEQKVTKMHLTYTESGMSTRYSRVPCRMTTDF